MLRSLVYWPGRDPLAFYTNLARTYGDVASYRMGGETVFFNREKTDIIACVYPKPNRLVIFRGNFPHVARGVSRTCPALRIALMFKTELIAAGGLTVVLALIADGIFVLLQRVLTPWSRVTRS